MDRYPKRLIEVDLPIRRISDYSMSEKNARAGRISDLHIWWARRPQAACRAIICAVLWPDPADELCPSSFRETAFRIMKDFARESMNDRTVRDTLLSEITLGKAMTINQSSGMFSSESQNANFVLRYLLLDFIADFSNWEASNNSLFLSTARTLTKAAYEALGNSSGTRPLVVDPFAGGGAIPIEALRVGADVFASDLNPVPVLINKVLVEYIPKYGTALIQGLQSWGKWAEQEAKKKLGNYYHHDSSEGEVFAYLWARTIKCEGPGCGAEVPLLKSLWLTKKTEAQLQWDLKQVQNLRKLSLN